MPAASLRRDAEIGCRALIIRSDFARRPDGLGEDLLTAVTRGLAAQRPVTRAFCPHIAKNGSKTRPSQIPGYTRNRTRNTRVLPGYRTAWRTARTVSPHVAGRPGPAPVASLPDPTRSTAWPLHARARLRAARQAYEGRKVRCSAAAIGERRRLAMVQQRPRQNGNPEIGFVEVAPALHLERRPTTTGTWPSSPPARARTSTPPRRARTTRTPPRRP